MELTQPDILRALATKRDSRARRFVQEAADPGPYGRPFPQAGSVASVPSRDGGGRLAEAVAAAGLATALLLALCA